MSLIAVKGVYKKFEMTNVGSICEVDYPSDIQTKLENNRVLHGFRLHSFMS